MPPSPEPSTHESQPLNDDTLDLLRAARGGSNDAWSALYTKHRASMRTMLHGRIPKHVQSRFDTEDVLQSAFLELCKRRLEVEVEDGASFRRFLVTVLLNKLRDKLRHHGRARRDAAVERSSDATQLWLAGGEPPPEILERAERQALILDQMGKLDPDDRDVLSLHFLENRTFIEIAVAMNVSETTARRHTLDALERLVRNCL